MARVGYARVSTKRQNPEAQIDALNAAGCVRVFVDKVSGKLSLNPQLRAALDFARPGDVLVVTRLARLSNSTLNLIKLGADLEASGIGLLSLKEPQVDTTTPAGRAAFGLFAVLAQVNREYISDQTIDGLEALRARGRGLGRPSVMTPEKMRIAREMYDSREHTVAEIARAISVSRRTVYRHLAEESENRNG